VGQARWQPHTAETQQKEEEEMKQKEAIGDNAVQIVREK